MLHKSNYFLGNDPDKWFTGVRNYREVLYPEVYKGVDLRFCLTEDRLKYEFIVAPDSEPSNIQLRYEGVEDIAVHSETGDLVITTAIGTLYDEAPLAYQTTGFFDQVIPCSFLVQDDAILTFQVGDFDETLPLIIDPGLVFSTLLGSNNFDPPNAIEEDAEGNTLIVGSSWSTNFPVTPGAYDTTKEGSRDAFITKVNQNGTSLVFSTFLGGSTDDGCCDIELDSSDNLYLIGSTGSPDFPITTGTIQTNKSGSLDAYIAKMNSSGDRLFYSTYLGGSSDDRGSGIEIDDNGTIFVRGFTLSSDFPVVSGSYDTSPNGNWDHFLAKVNSTATRLEYCTYIGGSNEEGIDISHSGFFLDSDGCVYLSGITKSTDFPVTPYAYMKAYQGGYQDGYVLKMSANGSRIEYSTYIGGSNFERIEDLAVDAHGYIYLTGSTNSSDFPTTPGAYDTTLSGESEAFLLKLNSSFHKLEYSTFFGGSANEQGNCIKVNKDGMACIGGSTASTDFPLTADAVDDSIGRSEGFLIIIDAMGKSVVFSTYLGGSHHDMIYAIHYSTGWVTVAGETKSTDFPTTSGAIDRTYDAWMDPFVARIWITLNGTPPSPPENLTIATGDRTVQISWDPPRDTGGIPLIGYYIYRGLSEENLSKIVEVGTSREHIDRPLPPGRAYYFAVSAYNWKGEGNLSNIVNATPYGRPLSPLNFTATPGCETVLLNWSHPVDTGGLPILGYRIYRGTSILNIQHALDVGSVTQHIEEDLENGRTYYYKICAFNSFENGSFTSIILATPKGPPSTPRFLQAHPGDSQIALDWRQPISDGGYQILGYRIYRGYSESELEYHDMVYSPSTSFVDIELLNGRTYYYTVGAFSEYGDGLLSSTVNATPIGSPGIPRDLVVVAGGGQTTLTWKAPENDGGTPIQGYFIYRGVSEGDLKMVTQVANRIRHTPMWA
jgi:hypothetical protein